MWQLNKGGEQAEARPKKIQKDGGDGRAAGDHGSWVSALLSLRHLVSTLPESIKGREWHRNARNGDMLNFEGREGYKKCLLNNAVKLLARWNTGIRK